MAICCFTDSLMSSFFPHVLCNFADSSLAGFYPYKTCTAGVEGDCVLPKRICFCLCFSQVPQGLPTYLELISLLGVSLKVQMFPLNLCMGKPVVINQRLFFLPRTQAEIDKCSYHFSLPLVNFFLYPFTRGVALRALFYVLFCFYKGLNYDSLP